MVWILAILAYVVAVDNHLYIPSGIVNFFFILLALRVLYFLMMEIW